MICEQHTSAGIAPTPEEQHSSLLIRKRAEDRSRDNIVESFFSLAFDNRR
jgi:hypothetical protein